jgi:non-ribosomal peptide synthetase component F
MTRTSRNFALLFVAGAAAMVAVAPIAAADPVGTPEAGSESAADTISDLIWGAFCQGGRVKRRPQPSSWPPLR